MSEPLQEQAFNAADADQVKGRRKQEKLTQVQHDNDTRAVMSTREGRRYVWGLLGDAGVYRTSFTGNATTYFNEGKRDIGLRVLADITRACPEQYLVMQSEAQRDSTVQRASDVPKKENE